VDAALSVTEGAMVTLIRWIMRFSDSVAANIAATAVTTGGISVWGINQQIPGYHVAALAIVVAAGTLVILNQFRSLLWQSYSAFSLGILRDVGVHMLLNRPIEVSVEVHQKRLEQDLDSWESSVLEVMDRIGVRDSERRRFRVLGEVPSPYLGVAHVKSRIAEKIKRLEAVIDRFDRDPQR
jgi:hypothetical protein